ncbi:hypothetical protein PG984_009924 [Apiospora sp. TS-2023a]
MYKGSPSLPRIPIPFLPSFLHTTLALISNIHCIINNNFNNFNNIHQQLSSTTFINIIIDRSARRQPHLPTAHCRPDDKPDDKLDDTSPHPNPMEAWDMNEATGPRRKSSPQQQGGGGLVGLGGHGAHDTSAAISEWRSRLRQQWQ